MPRTLSLACDACRQRKIKCNARLPQCNSCQTSDLACTYDLPRRKRGPKPHVRSPGDGQPRSRVNVSVWHPGTPLNDNIGQNNETQTSVANANTPLNLSSPRLSTLPSQSAASDQPSPYHSYHLATSPTSQPVVDQQSPSPLAIQKNLVASIDKIGYSVTDVAERCVQRTMQQLFPIVPIVHQPSLIASLPLLSQPFALPHFLANGTLDHTNQSSFEDIRAFTLLTGLCAVVCAVDGVTTSRDDVSLAHTFLHASRSMLATYEHFDIENPSSSSMVIRVLQSSSFHSLGKTQVSLYVLSCAYHFALLMKVYDESSLEGVDPIEAKIRRNVFWCLFVADKSASILNNIPSAIQEISLERPITLRFSGSETVELLDSSAVLHAQPYESMLHDGFYLCNKLWSSSSDILLSLRILARMGAKSAESGSSSLEPASQSILDSYVDFCGFLDTLPSWLRDPESHHVGDEATDQFQRRSFWIQRANLLVTFHCLRLVILRKALEVGVPHLLGLTDDPATLGLRKIEISSDLVWAAGAVPFEALQSNGEACVEKLRQAGVGLLEIQHQIVNRAIASRAKTVFTELLDLISRLDSRVSDALGCDWTN
ncbi:transcriptional regulatory protein [Paramyrothecium foliicola]|nr:transcriptional regulatory protein [Paramyrothecium foliicola]